MNIVVTAFLVFSLSEVFVQSEETACQYCKVFVLYADGYGVDPRYNTTWKMAGVLEDMCQNKVEPQTGDKKFCKALEGKYNEYAESYFQHKNDLEVDPCWVTQICSAKSVRFYTLAKLSQTFALSNEAPVCENCRKAVEILDGGEINPEFNTPETFAIGLQKISEDAQMLPPQFAERKLCKALEGKCDVFAKAYFQHKDDPEVDPCKEAQVC